MEKGLNHIEKMIRGRGQSIPAYILEGKEYQLALIQSFKTDELLESVYSNDQITLTEHVILKSEGFYELQRTWKNNQIDQGAFIFVTQINTLMVPTFSMIPCVMYHENQYGKGNEPKGLYKEGEPWIFGYSRTGLPSASISEGEKACVGVFADPHTRESLISSCSLMKNEDGTYEHRLYYPEIEWPVAYTNRDAYSEPILNFITLDKGECFTTTAYVVVSEPKYRNYGMIAVYDKASQVLNFDMEQHLTNEEIWERGIDYIKNWLLVEEKGHTLFSIGCMPNEKGEVMQRTGGRYEIGWCGQNASLAMALIIDGIASGNEEHLGKGMAVIDTWVGHNRHHNGWIPVHLPDNLVEPLQTVSDTCNMGWAAFQVLNAYSTLKASGIEKTSWYDYGIRFCDAMCANYSQEYAFGKTWNNHWEMVEGDGTIGAFVNLALLEAYRLTLDGKYLAVAEKAVHFYDRRDLSQFTCTAGALDTCCIDKETCWPLMNASLTLYELTKNAYYLEVAERAGYYMLSWTYMYDVIYDFDCDFSKLSFRTKGATAVSAQHHHLDPWGALIANEFERLYHLSGMKKWHKWALMLWRNSSLCIADDDMTHKGITYPRGAQGEASFHTNWTFLGDYTQDKGMINQWFVAWPTAFRLCTLMWNKNFLQEER